MRRNAGILIFLAIVTTTAFTALARLVEAWSFDRLFKEADVVVITQPVKSEDSADRTKDNLWKVEFHGVNTTFTNCYALKGNVPSELVVLHYKTDVLLVDGPCLVSFRTNGASYTLEVKGRDPVKVQESGPATYLLFLKKRTDGRFEPVSGQIDPAFSVKELRDPSPLEKRE